KFMDDQWMKESGFTDSLWETQTVGDLLRQLPPREVLTATSPQSVSSAVGTMKEKGISQLPVVDDGRLVGIITESDLLAKIVDGRASLSSSVAEVMFRSVNTVTATDDASALLEVFGRGEVGLVLEDEALVGILTKMDLVDRLTGSLQG
ncbi:MAG: CBS domain-containing protein, partial [Planctomycetota bacterium]|nr:CBS domain-containing protein [Planctomycetota bacterium]